MIFLTLGSTTVPLGVQNADLAEFSVDLAELLYAPQTALPGDETDPPARPPYTIPYAPGTLSWPQGASRFSVGQYLVTEEEIQALWPTFSLFSSLPVTLQLGGTSEGTGQPGVTFSLYPLYLLPLGVNRSATVPTGQAQALYLLVLVDQRYYFQTDPPDWTITEGVTTWDDLDTDLLTYLPPGSTADPVPADYLLPSASLAPPELASLGVVGWAGPLLDAICLASGRRFVSNTDGTCTLQSWQVADTAGADALDANIAYIRDGGFVSYDPAAETTTGLYVVPTTITCVYPQQDSTPAETVPYEVSTTFAAVRSAAGYGTDNVGSMEGTLRVGMGLWGDGTNDADLDAHALQWSTDWYAWLRGTSLYVYSGCVDFPPNGYTDTVTWVVVDGDAYTVVARGLLNPRPGIPVPGYSGVTPLGPVYPPGSTTVFLGPVIFYGSTLTITNETVTINGTTVFNFASTTTINFAGINVYTGPQYYPLYDYTGSSFGGDVTNWTIPAGNARIRISSTLEYVFINSINPGTTPSGRLLYLYNVGAYTILIVNEAAAEGTASKRILTTDGNFYAIAPTDCVCLAYDLTTQRWRVSENSHKRLTKYHTYTEWSGNQSDVALLPEVELHAVSSDAAINWDGITNGLFTLRHRVVNNGDFTITLLDEGSSSSTAGNRFVLPGFTSYEFLPRQELVFEYDDTAAGGDGAWHVLGLIPAQATPVSVTLVTDVCHYTEVDTAVASAVTVGSTTWTDCTGASVTVTPTETTTYLVWGVFDINGNGSAAVVFDPIGTADAVDVYSGALNVEGTREAEFAIFAPAHPDQRATVTQMWVLVLAAGTHTLKLQGQRTSGTGSAQFDVNTTITSAAVPILTRETRPVGIPGGTVGTATCTADPSDCCETDPPVVDTECCPDDLWPAVMYAHFSGGTGDCTCLDGETVTMTWDGTKWAGTATLCGDETPLIMLCSAGVFSFGNDPLVITGCLISGVIASNLDCAAYAVEWENAEALGCCAGTVDILVNSTP